MNEYCNPHMCAEGEYGRVMSGHVHEGLRLRGCGR